MKLQIILLCLLLSSALQGQQEQQKLSIEAIAPGVYLHTSYMRLPEYGVIPSNGLVVVHAGDAYIIDTPWPERDVVRLVEWIENQGWRLRAAVSTHFHNDRTAGIRYLNYLPVDTYALKKTNEHLAAAGLPQARSEINQKVYELLQGVIEVFYPGAGHTDDNIVVWLPQARILYGGCFIKGPGAKGLGNIADADLTAWLPSIRGLQSRYTDIKTVVPGHGRAAGEELLSHTAGLLLEVAGESKPIGERQE